MADYGLTPQGPNIKRLDVILEEMHSGLSEKWGVNTRQNPESLLNHLLTNVADAIADLWEFGEAVYFSQYGDMTDDQIVDMLETDLCEYCEGRKGVVGQCDGKFCDEAIEAWKGAYVK